MSWFYRRTCKEGGPHQFEARYDEVPLGPLKLHDATFTAEETRSLLVHKVYVCDVCSTCGTVVPRNGIPPEMALR